MEIFNDFLIFAIAAFAQYRKPYFSY